MIFKHKHLLGLKSLTKTDIIKILDSAKTMKNILKSKSKKSPMLAGKTVMIMFFENSTRTRLSFELAGKLLGADVINMTVSASSVSKGESLIDTVKTIDAMQTDILIVRHNQSGAVKLISENVQAFVINAGDGMNEHPTQALLDIFTIQENKKNIEGLKVAIIGDILHSRVAKSNIYGLTKLGAEVRVAGPLTLLPPHLERLGAKVFTSVDGAVLDADVVMGLRIQTERQKAGLFPSLSEYSNFFGINEKIMSFAKPNALIMHPGPVNQGVELTPGILENENCVINDQVTNGVAIRMALLEILGNKGEDILEDID